MQQGTKDFLNPLNNKEFTNKVGTAVAALITALSLALINWVNTVLSAGAPVQ